MLFSWPCLAAPARAHDVSDELTLGAIKSAGSSRSYWSDRLAGSVDASDALSFALGAGVTHYEQSKSSKPGDIFQLSLGSSWLPSPHWAFDVDAYLSPQSRDVERIGTAQVRAIRDKTSSLGVALGAEYDTAGDSDAESVISTSIGAMSYSTTQRVRMRGAAQGAAEHAALVQWRALAAFSETLFDDTDAGVAFSYYIYSRDPTQSGYYGETVFGRISVGDGIPVLPLRYSLRPSLTHRFGALQLRAYFQFGKYMMSGQSSLMSGLKAQYKFSQLVRAWLAANLQHDTDDYSILWASAGLRFVF